ncbi:hypothetical protein F5J09_14365 (plasmid) [Lacticaseibacillus paracasei]|nr:hypothetical protein F5J09_14365 [Lacticaseibacillus paracasei]
MKTSLNIYAIWRITVLNHFMTKRLFYRFIGSISNGICAYSDCLINLFNLFGVIDYIALAKE